MEKKLWFLLQKKEICCLILNDMKKIVFCLILFKSIAFLAQEKPFYEQLAFDHFSKKIIDSFPVKKKIRVYKYFIDFQPNYFFESHYANKKIKKIESYSKTQFKFESNYSELNFSKIDKRQFKIKRKVKEKYPRLFISAPHKEIENKNQILVNIYLEETELNKTIYHLEFDKEGRILNWYREKLEIIIIH